MTALLLVLAACGPTQVAECPHDPAAWWGGPATHRTRGGPAFDYDPPGALVTRVRGAAPVTEGAFAWEVAYAEDAWVRHGEVRGYGWREGGLLSQVTESRWEDVLGAVTRVWRAERWSGCAVEAEETREVEGETPVLLLETGGAVAEGVVETLTTSPDRPWVVASTYRVDGTIEEDWTEVDGEGWYVAREDADGVRRAGFHLLDGGGTEDGAYIRGRDGTRTYVYDRVPPEGEWAVLHVYWVLRYDGSGHGQVVGEGTDGTTLTCWYTWDTAGDGAWWCDDGSSGGY